MANRCLIVLFLLLGMLGMETCKNNDEVFPAKVSSFLNVVNATGDTLNFYLDGTRKNNTSSIYPGGQSYYATVQAGQYSFGIKKAGDYQLLASMPVTLQDSVDYTVYVAGASGGQSFYSTDALIADTAANTTEIRFVNATPDAGSLDFHAGDTASYKSAAFKGQSQFLVTGYGTKEVKIYQSGAPTPLVDTSLTFQQGYIYTVFSRGLLNGKGSAQFSVGVAVNSTGN